MQFALSIDCEWNPKWNFFVEKLEPFPFLTIFKGSFKFCEYCKIWCHEETVPWALLSKSLMDFLSKWEIYRALPPQCFKVFLQRQIQIVQHLQIWIRKFERWNEAVLPSMHPNHRFVYLKIPSDALTGVVKMGWMVLEIWQSALL